MKRWFSSQETIASKLQTWVETYRAQHISSQLPDLPLKIHLAPKDLVEKFIKGSGPGGQKINKTNSCVFLEHLPTGIQIKCQKTRYLPLNRKEALRELVLRLDESVNGNLSKRQQQKERERRRERKRYQRAKAKYSNKLISATTTSSSLLSPPSIEAENTLQHVPHELMKDNVS
jgi:protein subunit release factor B